MKIAPGIGATFYGDLPRDITRHPDVVLACETVTLHTAADVTDPKSAGEVRRINPHAHVWLAIPGNYLSRLDLTRGRAAAVAEVRRCATVARDIGATVFEINGEGASDGATAGDWTSSAGDEAERTRLMSLAVALLDAARDALSGQCALAWTSHDMPAFRLPWRAVLDRVDLHAPQHYPAQAGRMVGQRELERRIATSQARWESLAEQGKAPVEAAPYGSLWAPYLQGWGHEVGALVWGLSQAPQARLWACPGSWLPQSVEALRLASVLRAANGWGAGVVKQFQAAHSLTADGIVGPNTLAALRLLARQCR